MAKKITCFILCCSILAGFSYGSITALAAENIETESIVTSYAESVENTMNSKSTLRTIEESNDVKNFIDDNFSTFVDEYNKANDNKLFANYIEYSKNVYIIEDEIYGIYLDFDEMNGYAVISNEYNIYELNTDGDLAELREFDELIYSSVDGFVYFDDNNICQRVYVDEVDGFNYSPYVYSSFSDKSSSPYPGQSKAGDGEIDSTLISDYVTARYSNYTYVTKKEDLSSTFDYSRQVNTSYYIKKSCDEYGVDLDYYYTSEGNCAINTMFNLMRNWAKNSKISGVTYTSTADIRTSITTDPLYSKYGKYTVVATTTTASTKSTMSSGGTTTTEYHYWRPNYDSALKVMPTLYSNIRAYAISKYGFTPESGFYASDVPNTLEYVAKNSYSTSISVSYTSTVSTAISSIDSGKAVYLSLNNSSTYGNHGVSLIGYRKYSYKSGWWIFSSTKYAYFYQIADGWNDAAQYFDPNTSANPSINFCVLG